jgi:uroporphyrinogen decarboxylase
LTQSPKPTLTSRERVRLALEHRQTDRIPIAMVCSGINTPARVELEAYLQRDRGIGVKDYLDPLLDIQQVAPAYVGPKLPDGEDIWGVVRRPISYGSGSYNEIRHHPLASISSVDDLNQHRWPDPDWFDYGSLTDRIAQARSGSDPCLMVANGNIFESAWYMRGFERTFEDLLTNPDLAHQILQRVTDFYLCHFRRMLEAADGTVDLAFTADDIGGQNGLLMSLPMWAEFIKPRHTALNRVIHEFGVKVIYHSDGAVMDAVDGLVDMGIDVLQALQFDAEGMNPLTLKRDFGDDLCFQGGVSVQHTLPFGTAEDVRAETESLISTLGKNGGYILGPSHAIQAGTPPENIVAMFDTASTYYPFS